MQSFVYVIESPSSFDLLDGRTEGRSLCEALTLSGISYFYSLATDRNTLLTALGNRLNEAWTRFVAYRRFTLVCMERQME